MIWALWATAVAWGHGGVTRIVELQGDAMSVRAPAPAVLDAMGLTEDGWTAHRSAVAAWMTEGLELSAGGRPCALGPAEIAPRGDDMIASRSLSCPSGPRTLADRSLTEASGEQTLVVAGGAPLVLDRTTPSVEVPERLDVPQVVWAFLVQGALHLVTGYDHVLFLLCLLFVAGPVAARDGVRAAGGQLARIVTAFTVGHSVTLAAAALDVVVLPTRWVEAAIALSIAIAAAMNVAMPEGRAGQRPWVALCFGLVHGFGFSSALAEVGLPMGARVAALLSFNVGIELAQLAVVALAVGPLARLASRPALYRAWVMRAASASIGILALYWTGARLWSA